MLWVNLIMDTLGALALATEPPTDGLMQRKPIGRNVNIITGIMWRNIIGQSIYQITVLLILRFEGKRLLKLTGPGSSIILDTFIFNSFVFCQACLYQIQQTWVHSYSRTTTDYIILCPNWQVFNEINSRDMEKINVFRGMFGSWVFMGVMASTVAFQVIIVEFLGTFAETASLSWRLWAASIVIGALSLPIAMVLKCIPVSNSKTTRRFHDGYEALPTGPDLAWRNNPNVLQNHT